jgi:opacity protein-like surface antigen
LYERVNLLPKAERTHQPRRIRSPFLVLFLTLMAGASTAWAQASSEKPYYARVNTFGVFGAYSGNSSHMLLGAAENRKLLEFGFSYSRKLLLNRIVNWQYNGELLPVALESDPVVHTVMVETSPTQGTYSYDETQVEACVAASGSYSYVYPDATFSGTYTRSCKRQWTIGEAISPVGFQWNFRPQHKTQPFLIGHGGTMYSTRPIPINGAGSFNFTFDLGAGIELYRSKTRSVRAEYRYHHISNDDTANENPGIDNGLIQVTYAFGR